MTPFRFLLGGLLLLFLGIDADSAYAPRGKLEVYCRGCEAFLLPGPECVLGDKRKLRLWIEAPPDAPLEIRAGSRRIAPGEEREGGSFSLEIPAGAKRLLVLARTPRGDASWSLALAETRGTARDILAEVYEKTIQAHALIGNRQLAEARKVLDSLPHHDNEPAEIGFLAAYYRSLLAENEANYRSALDEIQTALTISELTGMKLYHPMAQHQLASLLRGLGRSAEAARIFADLQRTADAEKPCEQAQLFNNQAWSTLLAREAGEEFADPTRLLDQALELYEACGDFTSSKKNNVLINLALGHLQEGRLPQAETLLDRAWDRDLPLPQKLWWLDLEARISLRQGQPAHALRLFGELQDLALTAGSPDGRLRAAFGKARSQEALGDRTAALETLGEAEVLIDRQSLQIPLHQGRETFMATRQALVNLYVDLLLKEDQKARALAVARHGRSRMLRQIERGDRMATLTPEQRAAWDRFSADYEKRRADLEERARNEWRLPRDQQDRDRAERTAEAQALQKELDEAFLALGSQEEIPEEPRPPRPGELILAYHPVPDGWVGFAADEKDILTHRFKLSPKSLIRPEVLAAHLLAPFKGSIQRAQRVRVLPGGILEGVDFHALPFDGGILLEEVPVAYGLDLPARPEPSPGRRALLVTDPRNDLPGAHEEARAVGRILRSSSPPWITDEIKRKEASPKAVLRGFATVDLLHYAGHGTFDGFGGWESGLLLAEKTRLALGDILKLQGQVPVWVVLSGCETGRSSNDSPVESLGLAHAFLLAGSHAVVASTRKTQDRAVPSDFFADLYREWDREPDLAVALQRAQLSWRRQHPDADWKAFRLFEP